MGSALHFWFWMTVLLHPDYQNYIHHPLNTTMGDDTIYVQDVQDGHDLQQLLLNEMTSIPTGDDDLIIVDGITVIIGGS